MPPQTPKKVLTTLIAKSTALVTPSKLKHKISSSKMHPRNEALDVTGAIDQEFSDLATTKNLLKPEDQLYFAEDDPLLKEEFPRLLSTANPQSAHNVVEFSFKDGCFVPVTHDQRTVLILDAEGTFIHRDSEEAKQQIAAFGGVIPGETSKADETAPNEAVVEAEDDTEKPEVAEGDGEGVEEEVGEEGAADEEGVDDEEAGKRDSAAEIPVPSTGSKKLTNQFNFCERATLTYNNPFRDLDTQTVPPPRATFSEQVMQWHIYDAYTEDYEAQQKEIKEKEKKEKAVLITKKEEVKKVKPQAPLATNRMLGAVKILERMINQNAFDEIAQDYRYWEDPSDEFREVEGTLLPLWKFIYEKTKKNNVTDVCWNPCYYDMFAVTYGCFDFGKSQPEGAVCLFTLKNPSYPEYTCAVDAGVMCVDIHPEYPYLIVIGRIDGAVAVYDVRIGTRQPQYESNSVTNKHAGIVWQVKWGPDMPDGELNFYSVSADGYVHNWVLMQNELAQTVVIRLLLSDEPIAGPDGASITLTGCGTTIAFHPTQPMIFLVGTEEGKIYKCSTAYSSMYLGVYDAHHMPVYKIDFNRFYPDIFVSCSADWRVKIWEDKRLEPLFVFDLQYSVGDVQWSPYSSTVFSAVTDDGKVHVFDLNINKYKAICQQQVVSQKKNKLATLAFNFKLPIMVVGDHRGCITSLKLSPNLRKKVKPAKKGPQLEPVQLEINKLDKLLALVREPPTTVPLLDVPPQEDP